MSTDRNLERCSTQTQWNIILTKEQNNAICSDVDEPRDSHNEQSQTKTNVIWYHLYIWNLQNGKNELICQTVTDVENKIMVTPGESGVGEGIGLETGVDVGRLPCATLRTYCASHRREIRSILCSELYGKIKSGCMQNGHFAKEQKLMQYCISPIL